jgi:AraC-like DNA-binding protein
MKKSHNACPKLDLATRTITHAIKQYLNTEKIRDVIIAENGAAVPPALAYITTFPRLSITLSGCHFMELVRYGKACTIQAAPGSAVFVNCNSWNKPDWSEPAQVFTFLLGRRQIGISLVSYPGPDSTSSTVVKTSIQCSSFPLLQNLVNLLTELGCKPAIKPPLDGLLVEAFLHACFQQLQEPSRHITRKGVRTHEMICMFVQENSHDPAMTRDRVARHFGLNPTHISRLFKAESGIRFTDYLNSVRINRAERLLLNHNLSVKEAASLAGYGDHAYFCRIFKKQTQLTPTEYKLKNACKT